MSENLQEDIQKDIQKPASHESAKSKKPAKPATAKAKAATPRKAASKTVKTPEKMAPKTGTVHTFPPRSSTANTMETFMTQKKQYDKIAQDATAAHKDHVEALMKSSNIAMKGMEDIFKTCMALAQNSAEKNAQAFKSLVGCKTLNEFTEAHNRVAQTSFDDFMSGATRLSELSVKLATDTFEPITDQLNRTMKFANNAMAA